MAALKIYLDTSVIGGCFDEEFSESSSKLMELIRVNVYQGMISPVVAEEISKAPAHVRELLEAFDEEHIVRLEETATVLQLTDAYMNARVVPPSYQADAAHIAYATVHNADVVVSWNFRHIVNYQRIHAFNTVNTKEGYREIDIRSPQELIYGAQEEL